MAPHDDAHIERISAPSARYQAALAGQGPCRALRPLGAAAILALSMLGCSSGPTPEADSAGAAAPSPEAGSAPVESAVEPASTDDDDEAAAAAEAEAEAKLQAERLDRFERAFEELSEPDAHFFSDNFISNETSFLQVAPALRKGAEPGGAYMGVGPEQNFTYIALSRPELAIIVDIRRQNAILHLYYKAIFDESPTREAFLATLFARPVDAPDGASTTAEETLEDVIARVEKAPPSEALFDETQARIAERIRSDYRIDLTPADEQELEKIGRAFFDGQLDIRFKLDFNNGRAYPSLRELMLAQDHDGVRASFLGSRDAYQRVRTMQKEHRVLFVVGDFAGEGAVPAIAELLREEQLTLDHFYVSNVEQYLLTPSVWSKWIDNVDALPTSPSTVFIRAYLDQGQRHPLQWDGHRTATVLASLEDFVADERKAPSRNFFTVATNHLVEATD